MNFVALLDGSRAESGEGDDHRARLMAGLAEAVAEKGYSAVTIGDIVRRARTSRRTFYEHFGQKDSCFAAAHEAATEVLMWPVAAASHQGLPATSRVEAYFDALNEWPSLTRVLLVDALAAGAHGPERRRAMLERAAELIAPDHALEVSLALVGGVTELALHGLGESVAERDDLRAAAVEFARRTLAARPEVPAPASASPARVA